MPEEAKEEEEEVEEALDKDSVVKSLQRGSVPRIVERVT